MPFDPTQPFEVIGESGQSRFDPNQPYELLPSKKEELQAEMEAERGRGERIERFLTTPLTRLTEIVRGSTFEGLPASGERIFEAAASKVAGQPVELIREASPTAMMEGARELIPKIPQISQQEGAGAQALAGSVNAISDFVNFFTTPEGVATLGIGFLPKASQTALLRTFAAQMAVSSPQQIMEANRAAAAGDIQGATKLALSGGGGALFAGTMTRQAGQRPGIREMSVRERERVLGPPEEPPPTTQPLPPELTGMLPSDVNVRAGVRLPVAETTQRQRPVMPETVAEEQVPMLREIRDADAKTIRQIQELFPKAQLTREQARELRNQAFPETAPEPQPTEVPSAVQEQGPATVLRNVSEQSVQGERQVPAAEGAERVSSGDVQSQEAQAGEVPLTKGPPTPAELPVPKRFKPETLSRDEFLTESAKDPIEAAALIVDGKLYRAGSHPEALEKAIEATGDELAEPGPSYFVTRKGRLLYQQDGIDWGRGTEGYNDIVTRALDRASRKTQISQPTTREAVPPAGETSIAPVPSDVQFLGQPASAFTAKALAEMQRENPANYKAVISAVNENLGTKLKNPSPARLADKVTEVLELKGQAEAGGGVGQAAPIGTPPGTVTGGAPLPPPTPGAPSAQAMGILPRPIQMGRGVLHTIGRALDWYSLPLPDRLAKAGQTAAKGFANMAREMSQRAKELFGALAPTLDPALTAMGRLSRATTWLNDIRQVPGRSWGYRNAVAAVEGPPQNVPAFAQQAAATLRTANLAIGQMVQNSGTVPGFVASGKYQRSLTALAIDAIRAGRGELFDQLTQALSIENRIPLQRVQRTFAEIKAELDAPGSQQTISRINQEFQRRFPKFPTDLKVKTAFGEIWMPVLHAKPFEYLTHAALESAQRIAFLERIPRGTIGQIRDQVVKELKEPKVFDDLVRALHGLPVDAPFRLFDPGSPMGLAVSAANRVLSDVFAPLKLTVSAIYNLPGLIFETTPAFGGWRNFFVGAATLPQRLQRLETIGAITRQFYNASLDPAMPTRMALSVFNQGLRKVTLGNFFNEMQERLAASTADVFAERAAGQTLSRHEQNLFADTARAMGFERPAAEAMAQGRGTPDQYGNFVRRAAAFQTGGNIMRAETSAFGANRMLQSLFRFQSYPIKQMNAFRQALGNMADSVESGKAGRITASSEQLAKFLFNTTAQGAAASFLAALLTGRCGGR